MTALVSDDLMEATWEDVGASSATRVLAMQKECGRHQQALSGFVLAYTSTMSPEASGLALYAYVVIFQAFKRSGVALRRIGDGGILRQWEASGQLLAGPQATGGRLESLLPSVECSERAVLGYIAGALSEDQDDPVNLTDEEYWRIVRVLHTAAECLHQALKSR